MVRKIPVRKHRGVKDPLVQLARRNACLSINAPPSNPKEQELPKSVLEIQRLCQLTSRKKSGNRRKKKMKPENNARELINTRTLFDREPKHQGLRKKEKGMPVLVQEQGECDESFFIRFSSAAQDFLNEAGMEIKHQVNFDEEEGEQTDEVIKTEAKKSPAPQKNHSNRSSKKRKLTVEEILAQGDTSKKRRFRNQLSHENRGTKPNKKERRRMRQAAKLREEHHEDEVERLEKEPRGSVDLPHLRDEVKFGEVAHRPPQFSAKSAGSDLLHAKPGKKDLILKQMMNSGSCKANAWSKPVKRGTSKLSDAQKHFLEKERLRVVQAYRDLKASRAKKS